MFNFTIMNALIDSYESTYLNSMILRRVYGMKGFGFPAILGLFEVFINFIRFLIILRSVQNIRDKL